MSLRLSDLTYGGCEVVTRAGDLSFAGNVSRFGSRGLFVRDLRRGGEYLFIPYRDIHPATFGQLVEYYGQIGDPVPCDEVLKRMAVERARWTPEQKEMRRLLSRTLSKFVRRLSG